MASTKKRWVYKLWVQLFLLLGEIILLSTNRTFAQSITLDGTLGPAKVLTGPDYNIRQEDGTTVGTNLFHSFGQFNLKVNEQAIFKSADNIKSIFSRVTGGSPSVIDGLLRGESNAVNLFFINPNGIIFGSNARLDVGGKARGSFVATTLDSIVWADGSKFSAINPNGSSSLLKIVGDPTGFAASLKQPGAIEVKSGANLTNGSYINRPYTLPRSTYDGQSLLLLGGDVKVDGATIQASGGRVELGGLAAPGAVGLNVDGNILSLSFPENVTRASVSLTNSSVVDVQSNGGGSIGINTQNLDILQGSVLKAGIAPKKGSPSSKAGDVQINATGNILFDGEQPVKDFLSSGIYNRVEGGAQGQSGNININAGTLSLNTGAVVTSSILGSGKAGDINLNVRGQAFFDGEGLYDTFPSGIYSQVLKGAQGQGGNININAGTLSVSKGAVITNSILEIEKNGNINKAGDINIHVSDKASFTGERNSGGKPNFATEDPRTLASGVYSNIERGGGGKAGNINIKAGSLFLNDGAYISASTSGIGNAGNVDINVTGEVDFQNASPKAFNNRFAFSGVYSQVDFPGQGNAGNVTLRANSLKFREGAVISTGTYGNGDAGTVNVNVDAKALFTGEIPSSLFGQVPFIFGSGIYSRVESTGFGNAGQINVTAGDLEVSKGANLTTSTDGKGKESLSTRAGDVTITVTGDVLFDGNGQFNPRLKDRSNPDSPGTSRPSGVYSNLKAEAQGRSGNITITAGNLTVSNGATLYTSTRGIGDAGNITIDVRGRALFSGEKEFSEIFPKEPNRIEYSNSSAFSEVERDGNTVANGNGGDIVIKAGSLVVEKGASISTSTLGTGNAGKILIERAGEIDISGVGKDAVSSGIFSLVGSQADGNGGAIEIQNLNQLQLLQGGIISTSTEGKGNAGTILIGNANERTNILNFSGVGTNQLSSGIFSTVDSNADGNGGTVNIQNTNQLQLLQGGRISTSTEGKGNAGTVLIERANTLNFSGVGTNQQSSGIFSTVDKNALGDGGIINIQNLNQLQLLQGGRISTSTDGKGNAGTILIGNLNERTNILNFSGVGINQLSSGIFSTVDSNANGNGGTIKIQNLNHLQLLEGGVISAATNGKGDAGTVLIERANKLNFSGVGTNGISSGIFSTTESGAIGKGGNITINANDLQLDSAAVISAQTQSADEGGNITINSNFFQALGGGQVITATSSAGKAGSINLNSSNVNISGTDFSYANRVNQFDNQDRKIVTNVDAASGLFANTEQNSSGDGGNIVLNRNVRQGQITLKDSGRVSVDSKGSSIGGNIELFARQVDLNNGAITSDTQSTNGGNITLGLEDLLFMRRQSRISTNAGTDNKGGDGGNIDINAKYIIGIREQNNDITANAFTGAGGKVTINSQGVLGIEERQKPNDKTSDITASSQQGVQGITAVNAPENIFQNSLRELPQNIINTNELIANSCIARSREVKGSFVITGSGALPERPGDNSTSIYSTGEVRSIPNTSPAWKKGDPIVEPEGIYRLTDGRVIMGRRCTDEP